MMTATSLDSGTGTADEHPVKHTRATDVKVVDGHLHATRGGSTIAVHAPGDWVYAEVVSTDRGGAQ